MFLTNINPFTKYNEKVFHKDKMISILFVQEPAPSPTPISSLFPQFIFHFESNPDFDQILLNRLYFGVLLYSNKSEYFDVGLTSGIVKALIGNTETALILKGKAYK